MLPADVLTVAPVLAGVLTDYAEGIHHQSHGGSFVRVLVGQASTTAMVILTMSAAFESCEELLPALIAFE